MRLTWVCSVGWLIGCGGSNASNPIDAPGPIDAAIDARPIDARSICEPLATFGPPAPFAGLALPNLIESRPHLTSDELAVYFSAGAFLSGVSQLYAAHRSTVTARFEAPNLLPVVNMAFDRDPAVRSDGLELWFASNRGAPGGVLHLFVATRASTSDDFGTPVPDPYITTADPNVNDSTPFLTADGQQLWFTSTRPPDSSSAFAVNIWHAAREGRSFTTPRVEPAFAATAQASFSNPVLSADQLTIYVVQTDISSNQTIWRSHRSTIDDPFPAPSPDSEFGGDTPGWLSADNCRLYLGGGNIAVATRQP